jgi:FkbM family methyltransferase
MSSHDLRVRDFHLQTLELNGNRWFDFEPHLASLYRALLRPGDVAVDGGANVGLHAVQMAEAVAPSGKIFAIEPVPEILQHLRLNLQKARVTSDVVTVLSCGLSDAEKETDFYQVLDPIEHELSGLRNREILGSHQVKQIRIKTTTLDAICQHLHRLDFVKLDLEGGEMDALRGGRSTFQRLRPLTAIEQDQNSPRYFGYSWNDLLEYFFSLNYQIYDLFGQQYTNGQMFENCAVWDFIGIPAEFPNRLELFASVQRSMLDAGVKLPSVNQPDVQVSAAASDLKPVFSCSFIDYIGDTRNPLKQQPTHVSHGRELQFTGWAIDERHRSAALRVDVVVDEVPYQTEYGGHRPDVAHHFDSIGCQNTGFRVVLPPGTLEKGQHKVYIRVLSCDQCTYLRGPSLTIVVD